MFRKFQETIANYFKLGKTFEMWGNLTLFHGRKSIEQNIQKRQLLAKNID